jgi:hypothetical protein
MTCRRKVDEKLTYCYNESASPLIWNTDGSEVKMTSWSESCFIICDVLDIIDEGIQGSADSNAAIKE